MPLSYDAQMPRPCFQDLQFFLEGVYAYFTSCRG